MFVPHKVNDKQRLSLVRALFVWQPLAGTDKGMCPTLVLHYGYFYATSHSWEIPVVCLRHHSVAGSYFLSMFPRVSC